MESSLMMDAGILMTSSRSAWRTVKRFMGLCPKWYWWFIQPYLPSIVFTSVYQTNHIFQHRAEMTDVQSAEAGKIIVNDQCSNFKRVWTFIHSPFQFVLNLELWYVLICTLSCDCTCFNDHCRFLFPTHGTLPFLLFNEN